MPKSEPEATGDPDGRDAPKVKSAEKDPASGEGVSSAASRSGGSTTVTTQSRPAAPARRPLGAKEVIQFAWKLVGVSDGLVLTLFKSVEKDEAEAQYERLKNEGYYRNLAVVDINAKIELPRWARKRQTAAKAKRSSTAAERKRDGRGTQRGAATTKSASGRPKPKAKKAKERPSRKSTSTVGKAKSKRSPKPRKKAATGKKRATSSTAKTKTAKAPAKTKKKTTREKAKR